MATVPDLEITHDGNDMFFVRNGVKIAKRGLPGTPQAGTWIPLEPGFTVLTHKETGETTIEFNGVQVQ